LWRDYRRRLCTGDATDHGFSTSFRAERAGHDRSELGVFLFTAEQYDRDHAALAVLLGLNGLRVSEVCATNIEDLGLERGPRTLESSAEATSRPRSHLSPGPHDRLGRR